MKPNKTKRPVKFPNGTVVYQAVADENGKYESDYGVRIAIRPYTTRATIYDKECDWNECFLAYTLGSVPEHSLCVSPDEVVDKLGLREFDVHPTLPTKAGDYVLIAGRYGVTVCEDGDNLLVTVGFTEGDGLTYSHRNAVTEPVTMEFKTCLENGDKQWRSKNGVRHTFAVPRGKILLVREESLSFPKVIVDGETIVLNTGGGNGKGIWFDCIGPNVETEINLPMRCLHAISSASLPLSVVLGALSKEGASSVDLSDISDRLEELAP